MDPTRTSRAVPGTRFRVVQLAETTSTNTVAAEAADAGEAEGLVIVADHQTAGRGRLGRTWTAPPGSALLTSILLRPAAGDVHHAVNAVACAAAAACLRVAGAEPGLKWPNDLVAVVDGEWRKLGGILADATTRAGTVTAVVVGLGLNLVEPPDFPEELRRAAVSLALLGEGAVTRDGLLDAILTELEPRYARLVAGGPGLLMDEYRARCVTIGQVVVVHQPTGPLEGTAVDVDDSGALVVDAGGSGTVRVEVGDVVHLRPA